MAYYTIELKDVVKTHNIFDFCYDFYDEEKRVVFEENFIRHFYFREIGCETIDRFKVYLQDKMLTVFPYYNELFKSASIKYDVLDNYKLTETLTRNVENNSKQSGISSTVGKVIDEQTAESTANKNIDTTGKTTNTAKDTDSETASSSTTSYNQDVENGTNDSTTTESGTNTKNATNNEKFLDTPQGLTTLTDSKYLSSLKQNVIDEDVTNANTTKVDGETTNTKTSNGTNDTASERSETKDSTSNTDVTGNEKASENASSTMNSEQRATQDNNTRQYSTGEQTETYTLSRRGNIGVDTDSDAITKHNKLQKTLKQIELMFFEECEDLFMLVF